MAKFLSQVMTIARGSVGGLTYTANQFHQLIMRAKTSPVNPSTPGQASIRSAFSGSSQQWKDLSAAARQRWNDYAATLVYEGPLGPYSIPGRNVAIGNLAVTKFLNDNASASLPDVMTAPTTPGFLNITNVKSTSYPGPTGTGIGLTVFNPNPEAITVYTERSFGFDPSRERYKGPFLLSTLKITVVPPGTSAPILYEDLDEGLRYFTRVKATTDRDPYRLSSEYIINSIAETLP